MKKTALLLAEGFEEVEALTAVDLLRRAGVVCDMVALAGTLEVRGSHGIRVLADRLFAETDFDAYDGLILPGGLAGTQRLGADGRVAEQLRRFQESARVTAAICAAPTVLGAAGLLEGRRAVCYPGMEDGLTGAEAGTDAVVTDGTVITSRGVGTAIPFALELVRTFAGEAEADRIAHGIVYA